MKTDIHSGHRVELIDRLQFYTFLEELMDEVREAQLTELEYELSSIMATYGALLDYYGMGANDPERDRVYRQLVGRALQISDQCAIVLHGPKELPYYTTQLKTLRRETMRTYISQLEAFADGIRVTNDMEVLKQLAATHDKQLATLFADLWTQGTWNATTATEADGILLSPTITVADQCTVVSAVTLSLLRMFDPLKMLFLCDAYYHPQTAVSMRALVGIVIMCYCWGKRMNWYSEVQSRLSLLTEDSIFSDQVCEVALQFTRSIDTEKIDRKMREEIIPELMRNPKLRQMPGITKEDTTSDDINPDWEQWMHESGLEESMREITEWQMEGADVNMSTFAQLKRYPFFYTIMNWFRPFDTWQADILDIMGNPNEKSNPLAGTILKSNYMCDSDKYSFCYAIREIPQMQRDAMMAQLEEQNKAMKENSDIPDLKRLSKQTMQSVMRQYVQNLYRFFKLFPNVQEFDNPFGKIVDFPNLSNPLYGNITESEHLLKFIGFSFKQKHYGQAVEYFAYLDEKYPNMMGAVQLQQMGLCYQKLKKYRKAIEAYTRADVLQPDSYWTVLHLAQCYHELGYANDTFKYYEIAESMKPDNLNLTLHAAEALIEMGHYEEALPRLHKLDYHHPDSLKVARMLAECNLLLGKSEQSARYYERIMTEHADELNSLDMRNAACNHWLMGNRERCFKCLKHAEKLFDKKEEKQTFAEVLLCDLELLDRFSSTSKETAYIYDAYCRYKKKTER